jgi:hypothetical protein
MSQKADDNRPGHRIPTLYGFLIVQRAEPPPPMTFAVVKKDWDDSGERVKGDMDVETYVRMDALSPKLREEVTEFLRHVSPASPSELHPDTRAEICPGWKEGSDEAK